MTLQSGPVPVVRILRATAPASPAEVPRRWTCDGGNRSFKLRPLRRSAVGPWRASLGQLDGPRLARSELERALGDHALAAAALDAQLA
jgi:hypothetical protein